MSYVGLIDACLAHDAPSLQESFGPVRLVLNTHSAIGDPKPAQRRGPLALIAIMKAVLGARVSGAYRRNPFFRASDGRPIADARVLSRAERANFTAA